MILVTGGSGFLGRHLVSSLSAQGREVRALFNRQIPAGFEKLPGVTWLRYDLLDIYQVEAAMRDVTDVYHCAAIVSFDPGRKEEMLHFNETSTAHIVNQALDQGIRKMAYVSSVAALGRSAVTGKEITEEEEWEESRHNSTYGLSKYMAEMEVWRGIGEGLNAIIINPGTILGAGNWDEGSARLIKVVYDEFPYYTQGITAWVDVTDVVKAIGLLMQSDISSERFILSAGNYSYKEVFTMMAQAMRRKPPYIKAGSFMSGLVWRLSMIKSGLTGKSVTITKETAQSAQRRNFYNNDKFKTAFPGFSYTPIKETITHMAEAYARYVANK